MNLARPLYLPLLLLVVLSSSASAESPLAPTFLLIEEKAESQSQLRETMKATVERVGANGSLVLTELNPVSPEGALLFLMSEKQDAMHSPEWRRATQIDPRTSKITLLVEAKDAQGGAVGVPVAMDINLNELYELRERPERQRNTILGAMLRNRWEKALSGQPDSDSIEARITPLLQLQAGGIAFQQPWFMQFGGTDKSKSLLTQPFPADQVDDLLGRTRRPEERIKAASEGRELFPLRSISAALDRRMEAALVKARTKHESNPAVWDHLNNLRSGKPRRLTDKDRAFFEYLDRKPAKKTQAKKTQTELPTSELPTDPKKGLKAGLEQLQ